jgi:predicted dehydrogenase
VIATIQSNKPNGDFSEETIRPTYEDTYTAEYEALYEAIVHGAEMKTDSMGARRDLEIFDMIMSAIETV